jgi:hypothetical protein
LRGPIYTLLTSDAMSAVVPLSLEGDLS